MQLETSYTLSHRNGYGEAINRKDFFLRGQRPLLVEKTTKEETKMWIGWENARFFSSVSGVLIRNGSGQKTRDLSFDTEIVYRIVSGCSVDRLILFWD